MKRSQLLRHMREHGCELLREGGRQSWWHNLGLNTRSAVPRHNEINDILAKKNLQRSWHSPGQVTHNHSLHTDGSFVAARVFYR